MRQFLSIPRGFKGLKQHALIPGLGAQGSYHSATNFAYPKTVKIAEMGPRDGLQNEAKILPTETKIEFINRLSETGLKYIESTSFVSKKWVPQMGDAAEVLSGIEQKPGITYSALVPNSRGMEAALAVKCDEIAVFAAATDSFSRKNINCSVLDSLERFKPVMEAAQANNIRVRGYVSCALGCPYEGPVAPDAVGFVAASLLELGCYEISLGDTIGVGNPFSTRQLLHAVKNHIPTERIAVHFHDTYGMAIANVSAALEMGISVVDSSVAGLGGCPYAKGASGNVATEDVLYLCQGLGIDTGVDMDAIVEVGDWICHELGKQYNDDGSLMTPVIPRPNRSKVGVARISHYKSYRKSEDELDEILALEEANGAAAPQTDIEFEALEKRKKKVLDSLNASQVGLQWPVRRSYV